MGELVRLMFKPELAARVIAPRSTVRPPAPAEAVTVLIVFVVSAVEAKVCAVAPVAPVMPSVPPPRVRALVEAMMPLAGVMAALSEASSFSVPALTVVAPVKVLLFVSTHWPRSSLVRLVLWVLELFCSTAAKILLSALLPRRIIVLVPAPTAIVPVLARARAPEPDASRVNPPVVTVVRFKDRLIRVTAEPVYRKWGVAPVLVVVIVPTPLP